MSAGELCTLRLPASPDETQKQVIDDVGDTLEYHMWTYVTISGIVYQQEVTMIWTVWPDV